MGILNIFKKKKTTSTPNYTPVPTQSVAPKSVSTPQTVGGMSTSSGSVLVTSSGKIVGSTTPKVYSGGGGGSGGSSGGSSKPETVGEMSTESGPVLVTPSGKEVGSTTSDIGKPSGLKPYEGKIGDRITEKGNVLFLSKEEEFKVKGSPEEAFTYTPQATNLKEITREGALVSSFYTGVGRGSIPTETEIGVAAKQKGKAVDFIGSDLGYSREVEANLVVFKQSPEVFEGKKGVMVSEIEGGKQYSLTSDYFKELDSYKKLSSYFVPTSTGVVSGAYSNDILGSVKEMGTTRFVSDAKPIGFNPKPINTISGIATGVEKGGIGIVEFGGRAVKEVVGGAGSFNPDYKVKIEKPILSGKYVAGVKSKPIGFAEGVGIGVTLLPAAETIIGTGYKAVKGGVVKRSITQPITSLKATELSLGGAIERKAEARYLQRLSTQTAEEVPLVLVSEGKFSGIGTSVKKGEFGYTTTVSKTKGTLNDGNVILSELSGKTVTAVRNPVTGKISKNVDIFKSVGPSKVNKAELIGTENIALNLGKGEIGSFESTIPLRFRKAGYQDVAFGSVGPIPKSKGGVTLTKSLGLSGESPSKSRFILSRDLQFGTNSLRTGEFRSNLGISSKSKGLVVDLDYYKRSSGLKDLGITSFKGGGTKTPFSKTFGIQETRLDLGGLSTNIGTKSLTPSRNLPRISKGTSITTGSTTSLTTQRPQLPQISARLESPTITKIKQYPTLSPISREKIRTDTDIKQGPSLGFSTRIKSDVTQSPKLGELQGIGLKTKLRTEQIQKQKTDLNIPTPSPMFTPPPSTGFGFIIPPFAIPGFDLPTTGTRSKVGKRKFKRTPSIAAAELGITSSKPFQFEEAGIGLRPVLTTKTKKRKKKRR